MPSHETLDLIADAYIPLLAVFLLTLIAGAWLRRERRLARLWLVSMAAALCIAWGFMLLDLWSGLFPAFGLDYSTHTAVSLAFVAVLVIAVPKLALMLAASFLAYLVLMLYQDYHTIADMGFTAILVGIPVWIVLASLQKMCVRTD